MKKSRIHNLTFCYIVWNIGKFITMNHIKFVSLKYVIRFVFESLLGYVRLFKIIECEAHRYMAEILPIRRQTLLNRTRGEGGSPIDGNNPAYSLTVISKPYVFCLVNDPSFKSVGAHYKENAMK